MHQTKYIVHERGKFNSLQDSRELAIFIVQCNNVAKFVGKTLYSCGSHAKLFLFKSLIIWLASYMQ